MTGASITKIYGFTMVDFLVTPAPDVDGFFGVGVLMRDDAQTYHAVYFYLRGGQNNVARFLIGLHARLAYEIRDESLDLAVPALLGGVERLEQRREFIGPQNSGYPELIAVVKRIEFGRHMPEDFQTRAIPARTR